MIKGSDPSSPSLESACPDGVAADLCTACGIRPARPYPAETCTPCNDEYRKGKFETAFGGVFDRELYDEHRAAS